AVGVKLIVEQPVYTIETNVHGTEVVLKHANKKKKLVVIASTSEVYGKSEAVPFREDSDLVLGPTPKHRWAYACSKAIDEFLALGVKLIVEQPVYTIETNVHGTEVVLKHANKKKKLVVIASTSEVYGKSEAVPFREDSDLVLGPTPKHRWAYACSKAIDEFLA